MTDHQYLERRMVADHDELLGFVLLTASIVMETPWCAWITATVGVLCLIASWLGRHLCALERKRRQREAERG